MCGSNPDSVGLEKLAQITKMDFGDKLCSSLNYTESPWRQFVPQSAKSSTCA
jgi:hypothetical protein